MPDDDAAEGLGKMINDFVCQRMGGKFLSWWLYLVSCLADISKVSMSLTTSAAPIHLLDFDGVRISFQDSMDVHLSRRDATVSTTTGLELMARGSLASMTAGALAAKTVGT
jgi:hypothetical protein